MPKQAEALAGLGAVAMVTRGLGAAAMAMALAWKPALAGQFLPRLGATLYGSDNFGAANDVKDGGLLVTVSPGLTWTFGGASARGLVDYSLNLQKPWRLAREPRSSYQTLRSNFTLAPAAGPWRLDGLASIGQQAQSAFDQQRGADRGSGNAYLNRNETATASLSPSVRFRLGGSLVLDAAHGVSATNVRNSSIGDTVNQQSSLGLSGGAGGRWNWSARVISSSNDPKVGVKSSSDRALLAVGWVPDPDWQFGLNAGEERSNFASRTSQTGAVYGGNVLWSPGPRTRISLNGDHRVFGNTYALSLEQRFRRLSLRLSQSRSVNNPGVVAVGARSNFDVLFAQCAALEANPARCDELVRQELQRRGLDPDGTATPGFVSSSNSLVEQSSLSGTWQTVRTTWVMNATRSKSTALQSLVVANDDFSRSNVVRQDGLGLSAAYRFSPNSGLTANLNWLHSEGDAGSFASTLKTYSLSWNARLGPRQQLSATLRHSDFEAVLRPYTENAVQLTFTQTF